jgi:hypothetical protein
VIFGRRGPASPIIDFWTWWPGARPRLTATLAAGDGGMSMAEEISRRVAAINLKLDWELSAGTAAQHAFTLSCAGNAELRAAAARWLALAPPADQTWEFHDARQPNQDFDGAQLRIDGHDLLLDGTRFLLVSREHAVDVSVYHPAFADLPDRARTQISFLCLDWALGEQAVEIWVGRVEVATTRSEPMHGVAEFRRIVSDLADQHAEPRWNILGGEKSGHAIVVTAQVPLRPARWPRFDTHVALTLPFEGRGNGLPTDTALESLRSFEDGLTPLLGSDGELLAHETHRGLRTLHYYVDGDTPVAQRLTNAVTGWRKGQCRSTPDPSFRAIRHLAADR